MCVRDARAKLPSRTSRVQAAKRHLQPQPSQLHGEQDFEGKQLRRVNGISDQGNGKLRPDEANLAHFKAPHGVAFVKELPKTAIGKIQKYVLRARQSAMGGAVRKILQRWGERPLERDTGAESACSIFCLEQRVNATCASKYSAVPSFRAACALFCKRPARCERADQRLRVQWDGPARRQGCQNLLLTARIMRCRAINSKPVLGQSAGTRFAVCTITPARKSGF